MQVKKFRYVSSRIDTGLKKPMAEQIKSTGTKIQRETAVCVKMTKTAAQRMNNQNDINKLGKYIINIKLLNNCSRISF